jgi:hypothetical protein
LSGFSLVIAANTTDISGWKKGEAIQMASKRNCALRKTKTIDQGSSTIYDFNWGGEKSPAILLMPQQRSGIMSSALLLHGFQLNKERMVSAIGLELLAHGVASLSIDLPFYGERSKGAWIQPASFFETMNLWRSAQRECRLALQFLAGHPDLDSKRLSLIGDVSYS